MKKISKYRIRRAIFHVCLGIIILILAKLFYSSVKWLLFWILFFGMIITLLSFRFRLPFFYFMLKKFEAKKYMRKFPGKSVLFFIAGCLLTLKLFPQRIALASISILTFADPVSHFVSLLGNSRYKKPRNRFKNIYGTIAGICVAFVAATFFVSWQYALLASVFSMITESFIIKFGQDAVDDNFLIPLIAGTVIFVAQKFFFRFLIF